MNVHCSEWPSNKYEALHNTTVYATEVLQMCWSGSSVVAFITKVLPESRHRQCADWPEGVVLETPVENEEASDRGVCLNWEGCGGAWELDGVHSRVVAFRDPSFPLSVQNHAIVIWNRPRQTPSRDECGWKLQRRRWKCLQVDGSGWK